MGIPESLIDKLKLEFNALAPTEAQSVLFPAIMSHKHTILRDNTGTGKTLGLVLAMLTKPHPSVFSLRQTSRPHSFTNALQQPIIPSELASYNNTSDDKESLLKNETESLQAQKLLLRKHKYLTTLMIVPTRELAIQIVSWMRKLTASITQGNTDAEASIFQCVIAGVDASEQAAQLKRINPRILVGTPQRLFELHEQKAYDTSRLQLLVVDEVDRIVNAPSRYEPIKKKIQRQVHPLSGETLIAKISEQRKAMQATMDTREKHISHTAALSRYHRPQHVKKGKASMSESGIAESSVRFDPAQARPLQIIISSATSNSTIKNYMMKTKGWMPFATMLEMNTTTRIPATLKHKAFIVDRLGNANQLGNYSLNTNLQSQRIQNLDPITTVSNVTTTTNLSPVLPPLIPNTFIHKENTFKDVELEQKAPLQEVLADDHDLMVETVADFILRENITKAFVFGRASMSVTKLVDRLKALGVKADKMFNLVNYKGIGTPGIEFNDASDSDSLVESASGSVPFQRFHDGQVHVICATEYEARGLDLPDVSHVFILGVPSSDANYVHMAGRASRFGREGHVTTLLGGQRLLVKYANMIKKLHIELDES
ncbi:hypothetical protein O5D80_001805 [Batrachochytrium dendrobatidis]|nr:hypothetical protein O5D80_001805 [Batrachochytrium dendrobatidis]